MKLGHKLLAAPILTALIASVIGALDHDMLVREAGADVYQTKLNAAALTAPQALHPRHIASSLQIGPHAADTVRSLRG